ncbi:MAG: hypothetical protein WC666_02665 [Candidatus Paceibacterota bacterium]|jgi:hypothetical protein
MKWILFTGTWRRANKQVEEDVRNAVREVIARGDGVVTGGATGVDYFAMDETLKLQPDCSKLKVIIPAWLDDYIYDYYTNWCHAPITNKDIDLMVDILKRIKALNKDHLIEMPFKEITQEHYFMRDTEEVKISDEVYAFQVNKGVGTQDTIDKAKKAGLPITVHKEYVV